MQSESLVVHVHLWDLQTTKKVAFWSFACKIEHKFVSMAALIQFIVVWRKTQEKKVGSS